MKLATLKSESRDGRLIVVSGDAKFAVEVPRIAPSLREAVENWELTAPRLHAVYSDLNAGRIKGFQVDPGLLHSPFPRAFQWADGSAFLQHVKLVRQARGAPLPETLYEVPLMYQGGSDDFLAPTDPIPQREMGHGTDFEGEFAVVTQDVPMGITPEQALEKIVLILVVNDVSLRGLIPEELALGFGFFQSKPSSAFAPFALTPDELGPAWREGRVHLPLLVTYNGQAFGQAHGGEMHFHFGELIAHAARTRRLGAGTLIGSGTVANADPARGSSCLAEKRVLEQLHEGAPRTPFMKPGDTVEMEVRDAQGRDLFGRIRQTVLKAP